MNIIATSRRCFLIPLIALIALSGCGSSESDDATTHATTHVVPTTNLREMQPRVRALIERCTSIVEQSPNDAEAWGNLGGAYDAHARFAEAITCYEAAAELDSSDFRWPYLLAWSLERDGADPQDVLPLYERAASLQPDFAPIHYRLGDALSRIGRYDDAMGAFNEAIAIDDDLIAARRSLGQTLLLTGDIQDAILELNACESLVPGDRAVLVALAQSWARLGNDERAAEFEARSRDASSRITIEDAVRFHVQSMAISSEHCLARAQSALRRGQWPDAIKDLNIVLETRPQDPRILTMLGEAHYRNGDLDTATTTLLSATRADGSIADAHSLLGEIFTRKQNFTNAESSINIAIGLDPDGALHYGRKAMLQLSNGQANAASTTFAQAAERGPLQPHMYHSWGNLLQRSGNLPEAAKQYHAAVRMRPNDSALRIRLGQTLEMLGRRDEAIAQYQAAVKADGNPQAAERLRALGR